MTIYTYQLLAGAGPHIEFGPSCVTMCKPEARWIAGDVFDSYTSDLATRYPEKFVLIGTH